MNWKLLSRMLGLLAMLIGAAMVFCLPWSLPICGQAEAFESDGFWGTSAAIGCSLVLGGILFLIGRNETGTMLRKEALGIVGLGWILAGVLGALPYLFSGTMRSVDQPMNIADAVFESISGFTTTGASVLTELEETALVPRSVLFWRSFTHWLGGMGIIVLFVAILGQLGAAGKALMRREVPGPINESVRPRVRETAVAMWMIYVGISLVLTAILWFEGMDLYESLCHTFGTIATGGFSTRNSSIGAFENPMIEGTIIVFMIVAGTNFSLFYLVLKYSSRHTDRPWYMRLEPLYRDPEFRAYLWIMLAAGLAMTLNVWQQNVYPTLADSARHAMFQASSIMTTTGFGTENFANWPEFSKAILLLLMFIGGCSGSTGGGIKVIRYLLFLKAIRLEIERSYRPNVVRPLRIAGTTVDKSIAHDVIVYFGLVLFIFISAWMGLATIEPDTQWQLRDSTESEKLLDCASAVAATLNNIGPGLGVLGPHSNYTSFSAAGKIMLSLLMLLGRLELFAILVLFKRTFWQHQ